MEGHGYLNLQTLWFVLIGVLWTGYFFLEGFDFGVGVLLPFLGRDDTDRRVVINTIGPVWDGNEVWLIVAGGATFAAFPDWYATLFSGFYLALFLILAALIFRGVAFANILRGVPINANHEWVGSFFDLLNPYALLGGLTSFLLFTLHGGVFLTLRTEGELRDRARRVAKMLALPSTAVVLGFVAWTFFGIRESNGFKAAVASILAVAALGAVVWLLGRRKDGWAFAATGLSIVLITATIFVDLYPRVMLSSLGPANDLTVWNASSGHYTLTVMTIVALVFTPLVLAYQGWTYWVFRKRVRREDVEQEEPTEAPA
jgi:cytochrome d ubiquinol oxidase subunit II